MAKQEGDSYRGQTEVFTQFGENSFSWKYIERPAFDTHVRPLCGTNTTVVEAGCGYGRIISYLVSQGLSEDHIIGIDTNADFVAAAQRRFPTAAIIKGDIAELPESTFEADIITCNMVFEHLNQEAYEQVMRKFYSWTKPGGILFYIEAHPDRIKQRVSSVKKGWQNVRSPWGQTMPYYVRTKEEYIIPTVKAGYHLLTDEALYVAEEGKTADANQYRDYTFPASPRTQGYIPVPARFMVKAVKY